MIKKRKKIISAVLVIVLLIIIGGVTGYKISNQPHVDVSKTEADINISGIILLEEFETDETKANTKYLEKIIEVTGTIGSISIENGNQIITLKEENAFGSIICHSSNNEDFKNLKENDIVTIKGICTGYLMDVILIKCVIIN